MEKSESETKKSRKRKRVKLECLVCHRQFDDDYRTTHNKTFHTAMLKKNKVIPYKVANAPRNPFEAAKKAHFNDVMCNSKPSSSTLPSSNDTSPPSVIPIHNEHDETSDALLFPSEKLNAIPDYTTIAAATALFPIMLLNESEPDSLADSGDVISEGKLESMCTSALHEPDVNLSSVSFTVRTSSESENESDAESSSENKDHNWLTCAGELSYLVEDLKRASELVDEVKSDTCRAIETFLTNAEELTQRICKNANKIRKMSSALLKEMEEKKRVQRQMTKKLSCQYQAMILVRDTK